LVGLKKGVTREAFEEALHNNALEPLVQRIPTQPGMSMFVHSGRIHAIDAGNLILEIQQNSDTTYRVFDWGRIGLEGKPRQLHIEESMKSIDFEDFEPQPVYPSHGEQELARSDVFNLDKIDIAAGETISFEANKEARLIGLTQGSLMDTADGSKIESGGNILLPYAEGFQFIAESDTVAVVTSGFVK